MFKDLKVDFPAVLALVVMGLFALVMIAVGVTHVEVSPDLKQLLSTIVTLVVGYYFGSSAGSKAKEAALMPPPDHKPNP